MTKKVSWPTIKETTIQGVPKYRIDLRAIDSGQRFFPQDSAGYKAARELCVVMAERKQKYGEAVKLMTHEQFNDAARAIKLLGTSEITLLEMVMEWKQVNADLQETGISKSIEAYIEWMTLATEKNFKQSTISGARSKLKQFAEQVGGYTHEVTCDRIQEFFNFKDYTTNTRRGYWMELKLFFDWCVRNDHAGVNPLVKMDKPGKEYKDIEILKPPSKLQYILDVASVHYHEMVVPIALKFFAGLRSSELAGLTHGDIDTESGYIHIKTKVSKVKRERYVPIEENLMDILDRHLNGSFEWSSYKWQQICDKAGYESTDNVGRKSYISYHSRHWKDLNLTTQNAGNSIGVALTNYQALVTDKMAKDYWEIRV